jgi:PST family polysaccharide transporter
VVAILLGRDYAAAVPVLQLLALLLPIIAVGTVLGIFWALPLGRDRALLLVTAAAGVLNVLLVLMLVPRHGARGMAGAVVAAELLVSASLGVMYGRWRRCLPAVA